MKNLNPKLFLFLVFPRTWLMVIGVSVHLAMQEITVRKTSMNVQVTLA